jgi:hypothetical protein
MRVRNTINKSQERMIRVRMTAMGVDLAIFSYTQLLQDLVSSYRGRAFCLERERQDA